MLVGLLLSWAPAGWGPACYRRLSPAGEPPVVACWDDTQRLSSKYANVAYFEKGC